jgi:uncharacterized protein (TIGR02271 family)
MSQTIVGLFDSMADAELAKNTLVTEGFSARDIVVSAHSGDIAQSTSTSTSAHEKEGGFMRGIENFFENLFGVSDADSVGHYSEAVRRGGAVVAVTVDDDSMVDVARSALADVGAVNIEQRVSAWRESGYTGYQKNASPYTADQIAEERARVIPVIKEDLEVGKRQVDLGVVRVVSRVVEQPVSEQVTLREEHATIERRPVDRPASQADIAGLRDQTITVKESAEKAVVSKTAQVVEEVVVGKTASTETRRVSDTVRNTVVDVQRTAAATSTTDYAADFKRDYQTRYGAMGGNYSEYEPAYQYGASIASNARYQGRTWSAVEADARRDWEAGNRGSNWERFKAAVQYGWERATGQI